MTTPTRTKGRTAPELVPAPEATPPASAAAFKRRSKDGEVYLLPGCGLHAKLRRPGLMGLVGAGATANPVLSQELMRLLTYTVVPDDEQQKIADYEQNAKAYREVAARCFVEPRMVLDREPDYDAGEIGPADITDRDYLWIYLEFVKGAAAQVDRFRVGPGAG